MKILHVLANAYRGGCEKNSFHLISATHEFYHEVMVLGKDGPMIAEWNSLGVRVKSCDILKENLVKFRKALIQSLPDDQFNKVIVWTNIRMPIIISSLNKYKHSTIYVHIGNPIQPDLAAKIKNRMLCWLLPVQNKVYLRPVSVFVQKSLGKDMYYNRFRSKVSLKPIVIPGCKAKVPDTVSPETPVNLGMVARLDEVKDHRTVIKAFAHILTTFPAASLHLAGSGKLYKSLVELTIELGIPEKVIFHGDVDNVYMLMQNWSLFLYATTLQEGLGGTVPEALSIGLPVVTVDLPMIREWDQEGDFIVYCKPFDENDMANKAIALLNDLKQRGHIFAQAPGYVTQRFSPGAFSHNYISN